MDAHSDGIFRFAVKHLRDRDLAKDVVQETYARLWVKVEDVEAAKAKSYLFTTAPHYGGRGAQGRAAPGWRSTTKTCNGAASRSRTYKKCLTPAWRSCLRCSAAWCCCATWRGTATRRSPSSPA
ncbi:MAG: sigma-70 family RNA polymerase sigma factor [Flavobacteriales bacterium]|nr:sigma-70 family RNA polymerase sigma factor [Flavobacteriales bacterium]